MIKASHLSIALALISMLSAGTTANAAITAEMQRKIRAATFEVVRSKPENDPLTYEKALPLELLPYIERTDKFQSIGTAFALGPNTFATAAHVLNACIGSQFGPPALRSADGKIYLIDRIRKFSLHEDFAVFSLSAAPAGAAALEPNRSPKIDEGVVAVGNALGEGIVIREGLYTSETPEDRDGLWKWIRFSAAASPGNSGGPLLDSEGRVIGVVIGKSPNENLNYSLPIGRLLDATDDIAKFDQRDLTSLSFVHGTKTYSYSEEIRLPLSWAEFEKKYSEIVVRHSERALNALLQDRRGKLFPDGPGAESIFFNSDPSYFPRLITQQSDDSWSAEEPSYSRVDLPGDGYVSVGPLEGQFLLRLHRSDGASGDEFYSDSKMFMDLAAKALDFTRKVGPDDVKIVSFGKARTDSVHVDRYGRRWQHRVWAVPFLDVYVVAMLLPTPDGYVGFIHYAPSQSLKEIEGLAKLTAEQIDVSFWGNVVQWQAYLKRRDLLPDSLKDLKFESDKDWKFSAARFQIGMPASVFKLDNRSEVGVLLEFVHGDRKTEWSATGVWLYRDERKTAYLSLWRQPLPPQTAKLEIRNKFSNMHERRSPYDALPVRAASDTYLMGTALDAPGTKSGSVSSGVIYGLRLQLDGRTSPNDIVQLEKACLRGTTILEHGVGEDVAASTPGPASNPSDLTGADAFISQWSKSLAEFSNTVGHDIRGRSIKDDFERFILGNKEFKGLLEKQKADGVLSTDDRLTAMALNGEFSKVGQSLESYWRIAPQAAYQENLWQHFLEKNQLPPTTAHSTRFTTAKADLMKALESDVPTPDWGKAAAVFVQAANEDRVEALAQVDVNRLISHFPRQSACTVSATKTSGKADATFAQNRVSLESLYPPQSKLLNEEGDVILSIRISSQGCATSTGIAASSGSDLLDAAAISWAETAEFLPGEKNGSAIDTVIKLKMKFRLKD